MNEVYRIYCEWDIGQDLAVFLTEKDAMLDLEDDPNLQEMFSYDGEEGQTYKEFLHQLIDDGLVGIQKLKVIKHG